MFGKMTMPSGRRDHVTDIWKTSALARRQVVPRTSLLVIRHQALHQDLALKQQGLCPPFFRYHPAHKNPTWMYKPLWKSISAIVIIVFVCGVGAGGSVGKGERVGASLNRKNASTKKNLIRRVLSLSDPNRELNVSLCKNSRKRGP